MAAIPTLYQSDQRPVEIVLRNSYGPYLCVGDNQFLMDAGCGSKLGYNSSPLFGTAHAIESWTGDKSTRDWQHLCDAAARLRARQVARDNNIEFLTAAFTPTSFHRFYIECSMLDQFEKETVAIGDGFREQMRQLAKRFGAFELNEVEDTWSKLEIVVSFEDPDLFNSFYEKRFRHGIHFDVFQKGKHRTALIQLKLGYRKVDVELLTRQIERLLLDVTGQQDSFPSTEITLAGSPQGNYQFIELMLAARLSGFPGQPAGSEVLKYIRSKLTRFKNHQGLDITILNAENYPRFRSAILNLQTEIYEPARQSPAHEFDAIFEADNPVAVVVHQESRIVAMGLAGPLPLFTNVRGMATDPYRDASDVLYMVDVTVVPEFRGGLGRVIKNAICLLGHQAGYSAIHGRNREQLARGMWAINLSLGSFEIQYFKDDYQDSGDHRDCFYYRCPLRWPNQTDLTFEEIKSRLPLIVNGEPDLG